MPELPAVEFGRKLAEKVATGRRIQRVRCANDRIVFDEGSPRQLSRALTQSRVLAAHRRGKYIWLELDRRPWPLFHFGMTGRFRVPDAEPLGLATDRYGPDPTWPPRFTKIHLWLDDGGELVMTNARRFGRIRLREDPAAQPPVSRLGFDPLLDPPEFAAFWPLVSKRSASLKGLLLDQRLAAGVGNWIADEVLYQARLDPRRRANSMSPPEARRLLRRLISVVRRAVAVDAEKTRFPPHWLFHHRWGNERNAHTARGERIRHGTVAGRTTAWVPSVQA